MSAVIKNNLWRIKKQTLALLLAFTVAASVAAIFLSTGLRQSWDVAVVGGAAPSGAVGVNFYTLEAPPPLSQLVTGRYDAVLTLHPEGGPQLDSIKGEEALRQLADALGGKAPAANGFSGRGTGTNLLGFLMMFLLLSGSTCMGLYADDKAGGQIERVAASPVGIGRYLLAHCLFTFAVLFLPTMAVLLVVQGAAGAPLGLGLPALSGLVALVCGLSAVFSLLLFTLLPNKDDSAKMTGNALIILTTILAGGFYAFDRGNQPLGFVIQVLPQKVLLNMAAALEGQAPLAALLPHLAYLGLLLAGGFALSVARTKAAYVYKT